MSTPTRKKKQAISAASINAGSNSYAKAVYAGQKTVSIDLKPENARRIAAQLILLSESREAKGIIHITGKVDRKNRMGENEVTVIRDIKGSLQ